MAGGAFGPATSDSGNQAIATSVEQVEPINAFSISGMLLNMAAANVANQWRLGGPAFSIDAACASALVAVYDAVTYLRSGVCDTAIAGGVYLNLRSPVLPAGGSPSPLIIRMLLPPAPHIIITATPVARIMLAEDAVILFFPQSLAVR